MIDPKLLRDQPDLIARSLARRRHVVALDELRSAEARGRQVTRKIEDIRAEKNRVSERIGRRMRDKGDSSSLKKEMEALKQREKALAQERSALPSLTEALLRMPNILDPAVPDGMSARDNVVVAEHPQPAPAGVVRPHWEVGEQLGIIDSTRASAMAGSRFVLLRGQGAALERALINYMVDLHVRRHGYIEIMPPYLVTAAAMTGTGQLPKFANELYRCADDDLYLIPTAEVPLTNLHRNEVFAPADLPRRYVSYTACFRREAGSYGMDTRGLIRNHQFNKVELMKFVLPGDASRELEALRIDAEAVLAGLGLGYRVVELCSVDVGFAASRTFDLEVWMAGERRWREISSCSLFTDFQARRLNIKFREASGALRHVHTINGSGLAIGRTMAAVLEQYQLPTGSVTVPAVLQPYLGCDHIG